MRAFFKALFRWLDNLFKVVKVLVVVLVVMFVVGSLADKAPGVPESAALLVAPSGVLVEQLAGDPFERAVAEIQGTVQAQSTVKSVVDSLDSAAEDDRIKVVVLYFDELSGGGLSKLRTIGAAIDRTRAAGKKVIAMGSSFDQTQYYLAARADEVYMHDFGVVLIEGFGSYKVYAGEALEKLQVDVNVFRVGEYKSFVEPYVRNDMSAEDRQASRQWLEALWSVYKNDVSAARNLNSQDVQNYADQIVPLLQKADGNAARAAMDAGLIDGLMSYQQFQNYIAEEAGESEDFPGTFERIDYRSYAQIVESEKQAQEEDSEIAVIVASGMIIDGEASSGTTGGDSLARLIRQASEDKSVEAVVLRVDSPGGSMFASEIIFDQLEYLKATGKPLVASMGSLAASGGYYISMSADQIWASETTISGSIGVGAVYPTFNRGLRSLGLSIDGVGTSTLTGQMSPMRELGSEARELLDISVLSAYDVFISKVADAREMEKGRVDEIARGRVWTGAEALEIGLVDELGGLDAAIEAAAGLANLEPGAYRIKYVAEALTPMQRFLMEYVTLLRRLFSFVGTGVPSASSSITGEFVQILKREFEQLVLWNDPRGLYYHCMCEPL
ncbi:MAG: signal peptide peptidase SppA [bacterium]